MSRVTGPGSRVKDGELGGRVGVTVSLQACPEYEPGRVKAAVLQALEDLPEAGEVVRGGRRVLLKPNIVNPRGPQRPICTHPQVLRAAAEVCQEAGCYLLVADQPTYFQTGRVEGVFEKPGYVEALRGMRVQFTLCTVAGYREFPVPQPLRVKTAQLTRLLDEVDFVLNLCKAKTHMETRFTGAIKNTFGLVAPRQRMDIHLLGGRAVGEAIVDCFGARRPELSLMDGVVGMEGAGPTRGKPRRGGWVAASADSVALDALAQSLCGFAADGVPVTTAAAAAGYGTADLGAIEVRGEDPEGLRASFRKAPGGTRELPRWAQWLGRRLVYVRPRVSRRRCTGCGACRTACPAECIRIEEHARIDRARCLECFCCMEACPVEAVSVEQSPLLRLAR